MPVEGAIAKEFKKSVNLKLREKNLKRSEKENYIYVCIFQESLVFEI